MSITLHHADTYLEDDLPDLQRRRDLLRADIDDALEIADAFLLGEMPLNSETLPVYADLHFHDANDKSIPGLAEHAQAKWRQLFRQQTWWAITLLETELQRPVVHSLTVTWSKAAAWTEQTLARNRESIESLAGESRMCIDILAAEKANVDNLEHKLERVLNADYTRILGTVDTGPRYLAFMDNYLRTVFKGYAENAGSILEATRNDMAEEWMTWHRRRPGTRTCSGMRDHLRERGTELRAELDRAVNFHEITGHVLTDITNHTTICEQHLPTFEQRASGITKPWFN